MAQIVIKRHDAKLRQRLDPIIGHDIIVIDKWSDLSPDCLKDKSGNFVTNVWEFSKLYNKVSEQTKQVWWEYPEETHKSGSTIDKKYWIWKSKGMTFKHPIRYPNGQSSRNKYECVLKLSETETDAKQLKSKVEYDGKTYQIMDHIAA